MASHYTPDIYVYMYVSIFNVTTNNKCYALFLIALFKCLIGIFTFYITVITLDVNNKSQIKIFRIFFNEL